MIVKVQQEALLSNNNLRPEITGGKHRPKTSITNTPSSKPNSPTNRRVALSNIIEMDLDDNSDISSRTSSATLSEYDDYDSIGLKHRISREFPDESSNQLKFSKTSSNPVKHNGKQKSNQRKNPQILDQFSSTKISKSKRRRTQLTIVESVEVVKAIKDAQIESDIDILGDGEDDF